MERDDIIEYSTAVQHTDEEGKVIRKKLWKVFWILLIVTIVEVAMGAQLAGIEKYALLLKVSFIFAGAPKMNFHFSVSEIPLNSSLNFSASSRASSGSTTTN